jgi:spermidine/putrescine transport system substrate-binding protein
MSIAKNKNAKFFQVVIVGAALMLSVLGCTKHAESESKVVNLAIWGNYITPDLIKKFEADTGIKVNISNYNSNEELLAKVQAGASGIDVAVPSDYMVRILSKLGLLHELDRSQLPNFSNIVPDLMHQSFDPDNKYSVPYAWSTAGIAVNRSLYKGQIKGWKDVFNNPELVGKISMLDDVREVVGAALKFNGYSVNSTDTAALKKAEDTLIALKAKVKMFRSDSVDSLLKKEVAVAHSFSTDAMQARAKSNGDVEFILPEEGGTKAIDTLVILNSSKNLAAAHKLLNFMLSPEVNLSFVKIVWGGPVLKTTRAQLPDIMKNSTVLFPPAEQLAKFEPILDLGDKTRLFDELWTRVKTN